MIARRRRRSRQQPKYDRRPLRARLAVAIHEAAHAVAAIRAGIQLHRASIEPTQLEEGHVTIDLVEKTALHHRHFLNALLWSAGYLAERFLCGRRAPFGNSDFSVAHRIVRAESIAARDLACATVAFLVEEQATIERVAAALLDARRLSGVEIAQIVDGGASLDGLEATWELLQRGRKLVEKSAPEGV